jgi:hypothetical protein
VKIVASADWREQIPFETPMIVADLAPGEPARCFGCGADSEPRERTELWAFKHRHPKNHDGYVRFYCNVHVPVVQRRPEPVAPARARPASRPRSERTTAPSRPAHTDVVRAMCPNCFVEVSATGECGICGTQVS